MRKVLLSVILVFGLLVPAAVLGLRALTRDPVAAGRREPPPPPPPPPNPRAECERQLQAAGKVLLAIPLDVPATAVGRGVSFKAGLLAGYTLYLRDPQTAAAFVQVKADGSLASAGLPPLPEGLRLTQTGELLITAEGCRLFVDGRPLSLLGRGWEAFWVSNGPTPPPVFETEYPRREMSDGFMREELIGESAWVQTDGQWSLKKYGGGMPDSEAEMRNYNFQRTVNPFSVTGSGTLTYGSEAWLEFQAEACFYFGLPWRQGRVDAETVPVQTDMLIVQGAADGPQVAFGWRGREQAFLLLARPPAGEWTEVARWTGPRPPLTNWIRIGLQVRQGVIAEGYLDGDKLLTATLPARVTGPFHVQGGPGEVEFDDVRAWTLPATETPGTPVLLASRNFAGKDLKGNSDPHQFSEWARGSDAFLRLPDRTETHKRLYLLTRLPLYGDFLYETIPSAAAAGPLPYGLYEVAWFANPEGAEPELGRLRELLRLQFVHDDQGWSTTDERLLTLGFTAPQFTLRLRRQAATGPQIQLQVGDRYVALPFEPAAAVHLAIARVVPPDGPAVFPDPAHHAIYSRQLHHELFETAPSEWSWLEGGFRMDCRWACQENWNFMACGGAGVPLLVSKTGYYGAQEHDYYFSLRPMFPSDAGDPDFVFEPKRHRAFFTQMAGWYVRRDLNFSFCMDGRNPLSGYAIVFGGYDNRETLLLRQGVVVATNKDVKLPPGADVGAVHWQWWNFRVRLAGDRLTVRLDNRELFDYRDPAPLRGGHLGFWTVRNGFTLARVTSGAQEFRRQPQVLYVHGDAPGGIWRPLTPNSVTVTRQNGPTHTVVTANAGAGYFAVRHAPPQPVELLTRPLLELPVYLGADVKVNLHLQVDQRAYVLQLTAPLSDCKVLLAPEFERGLRDFPEPLTVLLLNKIEHFRIPTLSETEVRERRLLGTAAGSGLIRMNLLELLQARGHQGEFLLTCLTMGNSSNTDYLLAGATANQAGASYAVGTPKFLPAAAPVDAATP